MADENAGSVKAKLYDTKYGDHSGSLTVEGIKIPAGAILEAQVVTQDE
ncbi:hypothetical protein LXT21_04920 [Myxococcus sp. K38C18041901]|nr:hypothetical protein [Myxococcus guangdongensis]MCP3058113.1 hypothetical protein [Myxococcus guangdongensis]